VMPIAYAGWAEANREKEKAKELKAKKTAAGGLHHALRERDNVKQLQDCGPQMVRKQVLIRMT
jgi:hypothetical protein